MYQSHRLRSEERRVFRRTAITVLGFMLFLVVAVFGGLSLFAKLAIFISSIRNANTKTTENTGNIILPPILNPFAEATFSGKISVSGFGEKDAIVLIFVNGQEQVKAKTDSNGKFVALNITLSEGENILKAVNLVNDLRSTDSASMTVVFKKTPPKLDISSPSDGQKVSGDGRNLEIRGETDPDARITVNGRMAIVEPSGSFTYRMSLNEGENTLKIEATDKAGNKSLKELKVTYVGD